MLEDSMPCGDACARKLLPAVPAATLDLVRLRACEDERGVDVSGMPREERRTLQSLYCDSADYNQQFETYDEKLDLGAVLRLAASAVADILRGGGRERGGRG